MAGELQYIALPSQTGLSVEAFIYDKGVLVASNIPCPEVSTNAIYVGDMPALPGGVYTVRFYIVAGAYLQAGLIEWQGSEEADVYKIYNDTQSNFRSINNLSVYMKQDGVTPVQSALGETPATHAYSIALFDDTGTSIIKQQFGLDENDNATLLFSAVKLSGVAP